MINQTRYIPLLIFIITSFAIFFFLDYQSILFYRPQCLHFIRQTDSLSFVANYFNTGMHFLEPKVFDLVRSTNGNAACEFPVIYYLTAFLYLIFGEQEFILRLLNLLIVFTGLYSLFRLSILLLENIFYAICFTFLFFSSTVLIYYTNNFLPDTSAFGFTLIAWFNFFLFFKTKYYKYLYFSFILFTLASLIKVTYFIYPLAALISLSINNIYINKYKIKWKFHRIHFLFILALLIVLSWNIYVLYYNYKNGNNYFLTHTIPIWSISKAEIYNVWDFILNYWNNQYYYQSTFHVFFILGFFGLIYFKYADKFFQITSIVVCLGGISYFLLFFAQFKDHDYYFITLIPCFIFIVLNSFKAIKSKFPRLINHNITKFGFLTLCLLSLNYGREKLDQRYNSNDQYSKIGIQLNGFNNLLDAKGISYNSKIIIISDLTPNGGLYFINRPGWAIPDTGLENISNFQSYIKQGAEYVILTDPDYLRNKRISENLGEKILKYTDVILYKTK